MILTWYNLSQSTTVGQNAVEEFTTQMEKDSREELNYLELAFTSIQHLIKDTSLGSLQERQERAKQILRQLRFDDSGDVGYLFVYDRQGSVLLMALIKALKVKTCSTFRTLMGFTL